MSIGAVSPIQFGKTLPMFMTPNEVKAHVTSFDQRKDRQGNPVESMDEMWARKQDEANTETSIQGGRTLRQRLEQQGMHTPPLIGSSGPGQVHGFPNGLTALQDGHHRIAVHAQVHGGDSLMPVEHYDQGAVDANRAWKAKVQQEQVSRRPPPRPQTSSDERRTNDILGLLGL